MDRPLGYCKNINHEKQPFLDPQKFPAIQYVVSYIVSKIALYLGHLVQATHIAPGWPADSSHTHHALRPHPLADQQYCGEDTAGATSRGRLASKTLEEKREARLRQMCAHQCETGILHYMYCDLEGG